MRDTEKLIKAGGALCESRPDMDINAEEIDAIYRRNAGGDLYNMVIDFYLAGVAIGYQMAEKEKKSSWVNGANR